MGATLRILLHKGIGAEGATDSTYHEAGVELVESLHGSVAEAVAHVLLHEVGVVQDVVGHQWLLMRPKRREGERCVTSRRGSAWRPWALCQVPCG